MKKSIWALALVMSFLLTAFTPVHAKSQISISVNGRQVQSDVAPFIENNRTYVPIRFVSEALGAKVEYLPEGREDEVGIKPVVTITQDNGRQIFIKGRGIYCSDGTFYHDDQDLSQPYIIRNNRAFIPIRLVGNAFHLNIHWEEGARRVALKEDNSENTYPITIPLYDDNGKFKGDRPVNYHMQWKEGQYIIKELGHTFAHEYARNINEEGHQKDPMTPFGQATLGGNFCSMATDQSSFSVFPAE